MGGGTIHMALACVSLARAASAATASHEVVTFDYGWRFHLGPVGSSPPAPGPPGPPPPLPAMCSAQKLKSMFPVDNSHQRSGLQN
eukprot:SAG31_NODE_40054_length_283_cov_1.130435_1_plen_84_part_01